MRKIDKISTEQRFFLLLGMIVIYLFWSFMFSGSEKGSIVRVTIASFLLLAAIDCLRFKKKSFLTTRLFGALVIVIAWVDALTDIPLLEAVDATVRSVFLLIVTGALVYQVATTARVSLSIIVGAIDGYLLLGLSGAVAANILAEFYPGAFSLDAEVHHGVSQFLYYSYITLTTVGYGDITPITPPAKFLSVVLGVSGQLYIATIIAILVGKYLGDKSSRA